MAVFEKDRPDGRKIMLQTTVLEAAKIRIKWIFDHFNDVVVSVSGGKDSSVLFDLAYQEAERRGRILNVFFLDQEAEYRSTIELLRSQLRRPLIRLWWYQVPIAMTNATSYEEDMLMGWEPGQTWMREKEHDSIHEIEGEYPKRFYPFIEWFESTWPEGTCFLVGLRSEESLNRYRAVTRHPGFKGMNWTSKAGGKVIAAYPLYDWAYEDVWTFLGKFKVPYNRVYDWLWCKNRPMSEMRVSNLIHEKAFHCLVNLQEFEPDTYEKLIARLGGVRTAALYGKEQTIFNTEKLPKAYATWKAYREFLLETYTGDEDHKQIFLKRFAGQPDTEAVYRQQVRQLLLNDWENNVPVDANQGTSGQKTIAKWKEIL